MSRDASEILGQLDSFVERFAIDFVTEAGVDYAALAHAVKQQPIGAGGVLYAFNESGESFLTGLSYQTPLAQVLAAVVTGVAVTVKREQLTLNPEHPLAGLMLELGRDAIENDFWQATGPKVSHLGGGK